MRNIILFIFIVICKLGFAQDGSDIIYIDTKDLNSIHIGKYMQIDFYNRSFGGLKVDTINLEISGYNEFVEIRNDDGFNNWFSQQYLENSGTDSIKFRIQKFKLLEIKEDSLILKSFGHYYKGENEVFSKYSMDTIRICKKQINQILLDANKPIREGLSIYRVYEYFPDFTQENEPACYYCFNATYENLFDYPIISDWQIKNFDYEKQVIELTESGKREIEKLDIPLQGMPVVLTLNGEIIYGFWFWNEWSSFGCDRVYTYPNLGFAIRFGLPDDFKYGDDPRFDERIKKYCTEKK